MNWVTLSIIGSFYKDLVESFWLMIREDLFTNGSRQVFEVALIFSSIGWASLIWVTWQYTRKYPAHFMTWIRPLFTCFYVFLASNLLNTLWALVALFAIHNFPFPRSKILLLMLNQWSLYALAAAAHIYYRRVPNYMARIARHKRNSDRFQTMMDSMDDAFIEFDDRGNIAYANPSAARLYGFESPIELIGLPLMVLVPREQRPAYILEMRRLKETGQNCFIDTAAPVETVGRKSDGTTFPISVRVSSYSLNDRSRYPAIIHDLTLRRELEKANEPR